MHQDSGYESETSISVTMTNSTNEEKFDYDFDIENALLNFEVAAMKERHYLLHTVFSAGRFDIGCGISPARTFAHAVILSAFIETTGPSKISFGPMEWDDVVDVLRKSVSEYFNQTIPSELQPIMSHDFCKILQITYEDDKYLELSKHGNTFYLNEEDVVEIVRVNDSLVQQQISILKNLQFCDFYYNIVHLIKPRVSNPMYGFSSTLEFMHAFCDICNVDSLLGKALREYLYYYKINVINDLSK